MSGLSTVWNKYSSEAVLRYKMQSEKVDAQKQLLKVQGETRHEAPKHVETISSAVMGEMEGSEAGGQRQSLHPGSHTTGIQKEYAELPQTNSLCSHHFIA